MPELGRFMNIISKFQDYYDSVLAHGRDDQVVYVRHTEVQPSSSDFPLPWDEVSGHRPLGKRRRVFVNEKKPHHLSQSASFVETFVLVAGRAYPVWFRHAWALSGFSSGPQGEAHILHRLTSLPKGVLLGSPDLDKMVKNTQEHWQDLGYEGASPILVPQKHRTSEKDQTNCLQARERFLARDFTSWHLHHQSPALLILPSSSSPWVDLGLETKPHRKPSEFWVVKNPPLHALGLASVLDPYSCFQNISQFISGVAPGQQMPLIRLSDQDLVRKKGFDEKYGFRTRPQKSKR